MLSANAVPNTIGSGLFVGCFARFLPNMTLTEFTTNDLSQITVLGVVAVIGDNLQVTELGGTGNDLLLVEALVAVPEPSTLILAGIGLLGLLACWRRNRRRA